VQYIAELNVLIYIYFRLQHLKIEEGKLKIEKKKGEFKKLVQVHLGGNSI